MATTPTPDVLIQVIATLIWACLSVPTYKNGLFTSLFFDKTVIVEIMMSASLSFCPGLLDAIQATAPPTLSWWKSLPDDRNGRWGVYAIVMEKPCHIPKIYVGSGTKAKTGLHARWQQYEQLHFTHLWPRWVLAAHRDGYMITHKGWLVSAPIPGAVDVPAFRLLFVAMEATFALYFWTMHARTTDYNMGICCPWARGDGDVFTYHGLCNHNALIEGVYGHFDLTREQLIALDVQNQARRNAYSVKYRAKDMATDPQARLTKERGYSATYRDKHRDAYNARSRAFAAADPAAHKARQEKSRLKIIASGKYRCEPCSKNFGSPSELAGHKKHRPHLNKVAAST
jgi:hypothetical protein